MIEAILDKAPESMAGMIEGMIKQHMPNYGKELNVQETTVYKPEYSWNYEVGSHLSLFNGKLKTDLAAFYMDTHDQQIAKFVNSGLGRMMVNAGSSESYGIEASFLASINKNLNMNVSYGYTHSTFKNMTEVLHHQKSKLIIAAIMYHCSPPYHECRRKL